MISMSIHFCLLGSQTNCAKNGTSIAHWQSGIQRLYPFNSYLTQHIGGHVQYGVNQIMALAITRHYVGQLGIFQKANLHTRIGRYFLCAQVQ